MVCKPVYESPSPRSEKAVLVDRFIEALRHANAVQGAPRSERSQALAAYKHLQYSLPDVETGDLLELQSQYDKLGYSAANTAQDFHPTVMLLENLHKYSSPPPDPKCQAKNPLAEAEELKSDAESLLLSTRSPNTPVSRSLAHQSAFQRLQATLTIHALEFGMKYPAAKEAVAFFQDVLAEEDLSTAQQKMDQDDSTSPDPGRSASLPEISPIPFTLGECGSGGSSVGGARNASLSATGETSEAPKTAPAADETATAIGNDDDDDEVYEALHMPQTAATCNRAVENYGKQAGKSLPREDDTVACEAYVVKRMLRMLELLTASTMKCFGVWKEGEVLTKLASLLRAACWRSSTRREGPLPYLYASLCEALFCTLTRSLCSSCEAARHGDAVIIIITAAAPAEGSTGPLWCAGKLALSLCAQVVCGVEYDSAGELDRSVSACLCNVLLRNDILPNCAESLTAATSLRKAGGSKRALRKGDTVWDHPWRGGTHDSVEARVAEASALVSFCTEHAPSHGGMDWMLKSGCVRAVCAALETFGHEDSLGDVCRAFLLMCVRSPEACTWVCGCDSVLNRLSSHPAYSGSGGRCLVGALWPLVRGCGTRVPVCDTNTAVLCSLLLEQSSSGRYAQLLESLQLMKQLKATSSGRLIWPLNVTRHLELCATHLRSLPGNMREEKVGDAAHDDSAVVHRCIRLLKDLAGAEGKHD